MKPPTLSDVGSDCDITATRTIYRGVNVLEKRKLLCVVMDGVGEREERFGNAVQLAMTPNLRFLRKNGLYRPIYAHGKYVGLPSNKDVGNSEVGHNALGAGSVFDQGAKLVSGAIESGAMFEQETWKSLVDGVRGSGSALHFIGLLSDGNVHSHENHLHTMMERAVRQGVSKIRLHVLFDGRDVGEKSAEIYVERLERVIKKLGDAGADVKVASAGGRMTLTMDRYEADWSMVERGWKHHVLGEGQMFPSLSEGLSHFRNHDGPIDQYLPGFVIGQPGKPNGPIVDGDGVIFFNFRGDRAIEISRAFTEKEFSHFDRVRFPDVNYAGMMEYDGDLHIPPKFLVHPPQIANTLSENLVERGLKQFACSETQKFGHVTYFWNGNRSGYFDESIEEYVEIPSDNIEFDQKPWMKASEIADVTIDRMLGGTFDFGRINFANGDMVGHTGNLEASVVAVSVVDQMLGRLIAAAKKSDTVLVVTADHGNCDEMFEGKEAGYEGWEHDTACRPSPKTSHTLSKVPLYVYDPKGSGAFAFTDMEEAGLANLANTCLELMGVEPSEKFHPSLLKKL